MLRNLLWECSLRDVAQLVCGCSKQNIKIVVNIVGVKTADVEPRKEERKGEETPAALWYVSVQHLALWNMYVKLLLHGLSCAAVQIIVSTPCIIVIPSSVSGGSLLVLSPVMESN